MRVGDGDIDGDGGEADDGDEHEAGGAGLPGRVRESSVQSSHSSDFRGITNRCWCHTQDCF